MWIKWLPWRSLLGSLARRHGFLDPLELLAKAERFSQPSEVAAPMELLRAGVYFHGRGLINARVIQNNLDWIWPYWVYEQFNPESPAFIPRGFSITQVNLTHRNWTAVGLPGCDLLPVVDPRGLVTPHFDAWSLDCWLAEEGGRLLAPSRAKDTNQELLYGKSGLSVVTTTTAEDMELKVHCKVDLDKGAPALYVTVMGESTRPCWLAFALRPYNPEGVSFIHRIQLQENKSVWKLDNSPQILLNRPCDRHVVSDYVHGDVADNLLERSDTLQTECPVGMATAAALYRLRADNPGKISLSIDLAEGNTASCSSPARVTSWTKALEGSCVLQVPDERVRFLFDAALRSVVLHTPHTAFPGPYTYKRFWFRDAVYIVSALMRTGLMDRARGIIDGFPEKQKLNGYFHSQEGEWDSNGQAIWAMRQYRERSGKPLPKEWLKPILSGARWIISKRLNKETNAPHAGLMPAGFSAEHFGNNDYYYWDDFWSLRGLLDAANLCRRFKPEEAGRMEADARLLMQSIEASLAGTDSAADGPMPSSPYRRPDSASVGCLVAGYPLQLWDAKEPRLTATADYLVENHFLRGALFHDVIHSGLNAYLTLHVAQVLLRAGDMRFHQIVQSVADLASQTGQWPEAIHPSTGGGCMGDGQHIWAAAEWLLMICNMFLREDSGELIVGSGIPRHWLKNGSELRIGPVHTTFGPVTTRILPSKQNTEVRWTADWHSQPPDVVFSLPGHEPAHINGMKECARLEIPAVEDDRDIPFTKENPG